MWWCDQWLLFFAVCLLSINEHHASLVLCWLDATTTAASSSSHTQPLSLLSPSLSFFLSLSCTELVWLHTKTFSVTTAGYLLIIWAICSVCICMKHQAVWQKTEHNEIYSGAQLEFMSFRLNFSECFKQMLKTPGIFLLLAAAFIICCFSCLNGNSSQVWDGRLR